MFKSLFMPKSEPVTKKDQYLNPSVSQSDYKKSKRNKSQNQQKYSSHHEPMSQMKCLMKTVLKILKQKGQKVEQFQSNFTKQQFVRNNNFEGILNKSGNPQGICFFYEKEENSQFSYAMFFGEFNSTSQKRVNAGIQLCIEKQNKSGDQLFLIECMKSMRVLYLYDWEHSKQKSSGFYLYRKGEVDVEFKGEFENKKFCSGTYKIFQDERLKLEYTGEFKHNQFDGEGVLTVAGKHSYRGRFIENKREGYGQQQDFINKTIYKGEFERNRKNGYGQLIYLDKSGVKLVGFWSQNFMKPKQGAYLDRRGRMIEVFEDDVEQ